MKTASYFNYTGPGRIGITVGTPRGIPAGYRFFRPLAPRRDMLSLPQDQYREIYFRKILGPLDPSYVFDQLVLLAGRAEPILLCYETPPFTATNWCHRRMAAEWFADKLGLVVPEIDAPV